jgi:hypothetical protein
MLQQYMGQPERMIPLLSSQFMKLLVPGIQVDRAPAARRAAATCHFIDVIGEVVVDGELFTFTDRTPAHKEDVTLANDSRKIGIARVVDVLGTAAADGAVERPVVIESEQIDHARLFVAAALGFFAADPLASILDHFTAFGDVLTGVNAPAVDFRGLRIKLEASPAGAAAALHSASFTWFVVPAHIADNAKRNAIVGFLKWMLGPGQTQAAALGYLGLPPDLVSREEAAVARIH